jgi:hypothetical protein
MAVVIEELDVQVQETPAAPAAPAGNAAAAGGEIDERALQALLARASWRLERLLAD